VDEIPSAQVIRELEALGVVVLGRHDSALKVDLLFTAAGASAVYASTGLERCLRDVRTAAQHIGVTPTNFEIAGQLVLGLDVRQSVWSVDDRGDGSR
jgi:Acyl-CoA dehydrogenase, C-terminal domain